MSVELILEKLRPFVDGATYDRMSELRTKLDAQSNFSGEGFSIVRIGDALALMQNIARRTLQTDNASLIRSLERQIALLARAIAHDTQAALWAGYVVTQAGMLDFLIDMDLGELIAERRDELLAHVRPSRH